MFLKDIRLENGRETFILTQRICRIFCSISSHTTLGNADFRATNGLLRLSVSPLTHSLTSLAVTTQYGINTVWSFIYLRQKRKEPKNRNSGEKMEEKEFLNLFWDRNEFISFGSLPECNCLYKYEDLIVHEVCPLLFKHRSRMHKLTVVGLLARWNGVMETKMYCK